jgi:hypothetical protein
MDEKPTLVRNEVSGTEQDSLPNLFETPVVDSGIPLPPTRRGRKKYSFPFRTMEMGESFFIPCTKEEIGRLQSSIHGSASYIKKSTEREFTVRRVYENNMLGVRCWRTK